MTRHTRVALISAALVFVLLYGALGNVAEGANRGSRWEREYERQRWLAAKLRHARTMQPQRREEPMRAENISDIEVREIQLIAAKQLPGAIVNIGPVVTDCPCEDGPGCKSQVWITGIRGSKSYGLLLSRIKEQWSIGPVQRWWLAYEHLKVSPLAKKDYEAYRMAMDRLISQFPSCVVPAPGIAIDE